MIVLSPRVAWLFHTMGYSGGLRYWDSVLGRIIQRYPETAFFTNHVPEGFDAGILDVRVVSGAKTLELAKVSNGYAKTATIITPRVLLLLLAYRPDLIISLEFGMMTFYGAIAKTLLPGAKTIVFSDACPAFQGYSEQHRRWYRRRLASAIDCFIPNTDAVRSYLMQELQVPPHRIDEGPFLVGTPEVMTSGEYPVLPPMTKRPCFLYVGQLIERKGLHYFLQAVRMVRDTLGPCFTVWIAGDGADREQLQQRAIHEGLGDVIVWLGQVAYGSLGHVFVEADVFVLPTLRDTYAVVVPEAMAFAKPVLCSRFAGASSLIKDGVNGWVFNPLNPSELAQRMKAYIEDPLLATSQGAAAQMAVRDHNPDTVVERLSSAISRLFPGPNRS